MANQQRALLGKEQGWQLRYLWLKMSSRVLKDTKKPKPYRKGVESKYRRAAEITPRTKNTGLLLKV